MPQDLLGWTNAMEGSVRSGGNRINQFLANRSAELLLGRPKSSRGSREGRQCVYVRSNDGGAPIPSFAGLAKNLKLLFPQRIRPQMTPLPLKRDEDLPMPRSIPGMAYGRAGNGEMISPSLGPPFRPRPRPSCPPCMLIINDLREAPPSIRPRSLHPPLDHSAHARGGLTGGRTCVPPSGPGQRCSVIPSQT